jgi:hypothetical protein
MADDGHGGKVPGKWKDSLPVIPDKVAEALDKGVDVPLEAMVSGPAQEMLEDRIAERNRPLRMENLIPVPKGDPRVAPPALDGRTLPRVPQMRRVIPAPYQRPSATIRQDHGRSWQELAAREVAEGDIVTGIGRVTVVQHGRFDVLLPAVALGDQTEVAVLEGMGGIKKVFFAQAVLNVFAEDKKPPVPGA